MIGHIHGLYDSRIGPQSLTNVMIIDRCVYLKDKIVAIRTAIVIILHERNKLRKYKITLDISTHSRWMTHPTDSANYSSICQKKNKKQKSKAINRYLQCSKQQPPKA